MKEKEKPNQVSVSALDLVLEIACMNKGSCLNGNDMPAIVSAQSYFLVSVWIRDMYVLWVTGV